VNDLALVTANFGGIDDPKPLPEHAGIDAFYYTDAAVPEAVAQTWTRVLNPGFPRHDLGPRLRAKYFKLQIHRLDEVRAARWLVWADGSLRIHQLAFLRERALALSRLAARRRVLLIPHPDRGTVQEEYEFVRRAIAEEHPTLALRYRDERMGEQMAWYRSRGWNVEAKLWCGGFWMMENSDLVRRCLDDWWDQNLRFGMMDQISLPVILEQHGIEPEPLAIDLWRNSFFEFVGHAKKM
jgi:hypothetical protein